MLILIPIAHLAVAIFLYFYPFFIKHNFFFDYLYISSLMFMILIWIYFSGECPFSYFYKIIKNPEYKCGETTNLDDFIELTEIMPKKDSGNNDTDGINIMKIVDFIFAMALITSTIIVSYRSHLGNPLLIIFVTIFVRFFYLFFNNATGYDTNKIGKSLLGEKYDIFENIYWNYGFDKLHGVINSGIVVFVTGVWLYITYNNRAKLLKSI
jgi:hypothetical protein